MTKPIRIAVIGAGNRGQIYADLAALDGRAQVVAVADPDELRRTELADRHGVPAAGRFADWQDLAAGPAFADVAVVATQDRLHHGPATALLGQGYHVLLEKPMAPTLEQCIEIVDAAAAAGTILAVCHVLRYTPYTVTLKRLLTSGTVGDLVSVEHLEPVGWWHFAHSFVRGNWRREAESSPLLLAKCVHDLDWLGHLVERPAVRVSSFGGLYHFRADQRPPGAGERCVDCRVESECPYSARRLYLSCLGDPETERWPLGPVTPARTTEGVLAALWTGPYGRCVYRCDNDVPDHQVVTIEYSDGATASFTVTAFTAYEFRKTRIFGTHGSVEGDGERLDVTDFRTGRRRRMDPAADRPAPGLAGHGGGDAGLVRAFFDAVETGNPRAYLSDPAEALAAHALTWAAERARRSGTVVTLERTPTAPS